MTPVYVYHRIDTAPRQWQAVADRLASEGAARIAAANGTLYGLWRSQIGRPRDEIQAITLWPGAMLVSSRGVGRTLAPAPSIL